MPTHPTVTDIAGELGITSQDVIRYLTGIGVAEPSATMPLGKTFIQELTNYFKPWDRIVRLVTDPTQEAPGFVIENRGGAIVLKREWDPQSRLFVWTKIHKSTTAGEPGDDLSFLCEWENRLLTLAAQNRVTGCVQLRRVIFDASPPYMPNGLNQRQHRTSTLSTYDAGPTLDVWESMKPRVDGFAQPHPFVEQGNFLQLVRGVLIALQDFHRKGFIHCDLHSGNIALPVRKVTRETFADHGEYILLEPDWKNIRIIDLDFSASKTMVPPVRLPHDLTNPRTQKQLSPHLKQRLVAIDEWLNSQGSLHLCYDREFWLSANNNDHLKCFQTLDWREDLFQLGVLLLKIRDSWGGANHVDYTGGPQDVNAFIRNFPEELKEWGQETSPEQTNLPHADYIDEITCVR